MIQFSLPCFLVLLMFIFHLLHYYVLNFLNFLAAHICPTAGSWFDSHLVRAFPVWSLHALTEDTQDLSHSLHTCFLVQGPL